MHWEALWNMVPPLLASMTLAFFFTREVKRFAEARGIVDDPKGSSRKLHARPMPLLGGIGIMAAMALVLAAFAVPNETLGWIGLASFVILIGGALDDAFDLPAKVQILFPVLAAGIVAFGAELTVPRFWDSALVTMGWLLAMTYTTKLLDGLDGLATGVGAIGALMIALLALTVPFFEPEAALIAMVFFGALMGFLAWNFNPAQIFLGESGSEFIGFFLGVLSILSGSKILTALLVVGIPMLDIMHVLIRRFRAGRPLFSGDRLHLHHLLAERLGVRKTVYLLYALSASFGLVTLSLQTQTKLVALAGAACTAVALIVFSTTKNGPTA